MFSVDHAIQRVQRDLAIGAVLRSILIVAAGVGFALSMVGTRWFDGSVLLLIIGLVWIVLSYRSLRSARAVAESPMLIAAGRFDEAEQQIGEAMHSFSLFRTNKLLSLHHLAMLRHAQRRWTETAVLCRALLNQRLGTAQGISKPSRLILADAMLELGDVRGTYEALSGLYAQRLSLGEAMNLLVSQLDYESRVGAWQSMLNGLRTKIEMAELMPSPAAAKVQAFLALAAKRCGRLEWSDWLRRRAELLMDIRELTKQRPVLWELWQG